MSRIKNLFTQLKFDHKKALVPFLVAGDPSLEKTLAFMHTAVSAGADLLEIGVPFSDPIADGRIIQAAYARAIHHQVDLKAVIELIQKFRTQNTHTPIIIMTYLHPIEVIGYSLFIQLAQAADIDGVLIIDLPADSNHNLFSELIDKKIDPIFLLSPTTSHQRIKMIAEKASGFLYYVSIKGITGTHKPQPEIVREKIAQIRQVTDLPVIVGFGIQDIKIAQDIAAVADGIVIGSALCALIQKSGENAEKELKQFLVSILAVLGDR